MPISRRKLAVLLPGLAAGQSTLPKTRLSSKAFPFDQLVVKENGQNKSRAVINGTTHTGYPVEMHITELAPGLMPHPPHSHVHEEIICILEGTLEVTIDGKTTKVGPGSSAVIASNEHHGWKNVGDTRARYFVFALGRET